jgi:YggT family protein
MVMNPFLALFATLLGLIWWAIFLWFILNLLLQFNIVNRWNPLVNRIYKVLEGVVEPMLRPIRRYVPTLGGIDWSPMVLILLLEFVKNAVLYYGA